MRAMRGLSRALRCDAAVQRLVSHARASAHRAVCSSTCCRARIRIACDNHMQGSVQKERSGRGVLHNPWQPPERAPPHRLTDQTYAMIGSRTHSAARNRTL
jgi:hypothetical protein